MLLEKLREYSGRLNLAPPMYQTTPIRWVIDIDKNGRLIGFVPTTSEGPKGKIDRGKEYNAPHIGRSSGVRAKLLADTGEYVLGKARDKAKRKRVNKCHKAFVEEVRACAASTKEPTVKAVLRFLEALNKSKISLPEDFDPSHNLTFRVQETMPIDLDSVRAYWASKTGADEENESQPGDEPMECLVCGERRKPVKRLQFRIKRIPGKQRSGMALISANVPAFESYGLKASLIAPTCQECGERFSKAANALIEGTESHVTVGSFVEAAQALTSSPKVQRAKSTEARNITPLI